MKTPKFVYPYQVHTYQPDWRDYGLGFHTEHPNKRQAIQEAMYVYNHQMAIGYICVVDVRNGNVVWSKVKEAPEETD